MPKDLPSPEFLRKIISYDPLSGFFTWKERTEGMFKGGNTGTIGRCKAWNAVHSGNRCLISVKDNQYLYGRVLDKNMYAHRVAWAMYYGEWPKHQIDHINGDRTDNRIENLRSVTCAENAKNQMTRRNRVFSGVYQDKRCMIWVCQIQRQHVASSSCFGKIMKIRNSEYRKRGFQQRHVDATLCGEDVDYLPAVRRMINPEEDE